MQIWPCHKVGQGQPRLIICANLVGPTSPMIHTKSQSQWPLGFREEEIKRVFTIYGRGGHVSHVTTTICTNFGLPIIRSCHMKFGLNWPRGLWENYVLICWWDSDMSDLGWKVNLDLWNIFIDTRLNISSKNNDWPLQYSKNQLFKKIPIQMHEKQTWPCR